MARLVAQVLDESGFEAAVVCEFLGERKLANTRKIVRLARDFDRQGGLHAGRVRRAAAGRPGERAARGAGGHDRRVEREHPADVDPPGQGAGVPDRGPSRPGARRRATGARWWPAIRTSAWSCARRSRRRTWGRARVPSPASRPRIPGREFRLAGLPDARAGRRRAGVAAAVLRGGHPGARCPDPLGGPGA